MNPSENWIQRIRQNLRRRQEMMQELLELEQNWPKTMDLKQIPDLIRRKQQMLDNLESLMHDKLLTGWEEEARRMKVPPAEQNQIRETLRILKEQLEIILKLHQRNLDQLQKGSESAAEALQKVRYELDVLRTLRSANRRPVRVDMVG